MSEYQYYEFQTLDRPLTQPQMAELRAYSSRAQITPTSFVNVYNFGNFKGDRHKWMEKYFDAFLYVANWGSHWLEFRIPKQLLDPETVSMYCTRESLTCRVKGEYVILSFASEDQDGEWAEGEGWLASLTPLRSDLMQGDYRCLYLAWLVAVQAGHLDDDAIEPPVPPGLGTFNAPLRGLADFLRLDTDLVGAAAEESAPEQASALTQEEVSVWVAAMPPKEKDAAIAALLEVKDDYFAVEFRQRAVREIRARAKAKHEREQAEQRKKHIASLVGKEEGLWSKIDALIATKQPKRYDEALLLLQDLPRSGRHDGPGQRLLVPCGCPVS